MVKMESITRNKRIVLYSILILLFIGKITSLNIDRINDFFSCTKYEVLTEKYHRVSSYQNFIDERKEMEGIYFGSPECSHCVMNIKNTGCILGDIKNVYYFKADFDDPDNQRELEKFKETFSFDTIPHIVIFAEDGEKQYSSKDISSYTE